MILSNSRIFYQTNDVLQFKGYSSFSDILKYNFCTNSEERDYKLFTQKLTHNIFKNIMTYYNKHDMNFLNIARVLPLEFAKTQTYDTLKRMFTIPSPSIEHTDVWLLDRLSQTIASNLYTQLLTYIMTLLIGKEDDNSLNTYKIYKNTSDERCIYESGNTITCPLDTSYLYDRFVDMKAGNRRLNHPYSKKYIILEESYEEQMQSIKHNWIYKTDFDIMYVNQQYLGHELQYLYIVDDPSINP